MHLLEEMDLFSNAEFTNGVYLPEMLGREV